MKLEVTLPWSGFFFFFSFFRWDWVHLVRRPIFGLLYQPRMIDDGECGVVGGMRIGRGNRSTRRKPASVPLYPPQIPHDLTWDRTRASAVGSRHGKGLPAVRPNSKFEDHALAANCNCLFNVSAATFHIWKPAATWACIMHSTENPGQKEGVFVLIT
jgi:hypothetical protein